ncbi:Glyoxalase-like domain protein [Roseivivax jejudonensis]|uniref:Glyoxalase-like domain protein n=1 Tax=Roseivivax jejudonensis TaxID=1529041 RepID=A0A1X6Y9B9_9RHOB|nr:VOC family protein [Roseivivax jejudonensis]SLN14779.1 Glyoxalase-like domain protein [Roseivivax jejudonensis]
MYKPDGYPDVSPYLVVADVEAALRFAETVFGAERLRIFHRDDGSVMHAEMRIGDSVVMLGGATGGTPAMLHVYVPDAEAAFDRATAAGATILQEMQDKGDGDLRGGVADTTGTQWYISRQL